jgi:hypothetical protein
MRAAKLKRAEAQRAPARLDAALDALADGGGDNREDAEIMRRPWVELIAGIANANRRPHDPERSRRRNVRDLRADARTRGLTITPVLHVAAVHRACERTGYEVAEVPSTLVARKLLAFT